MSRSCSLRCLLDSHSPINLPHNIETIIGRSKTTKIKDSSCSRQQISLKPDCDKCIVEVKQLGVNASGIDGFALKRYESYKVEHGSKIEILFSKYFHLIEFEPPLDQCDDKKINRKRKQDEESTLNIIKKRKTENTSTEMQEAAEDIWDNIDNGALYVLTTKGVKPSSKIAAFDMDGTLITTKSGKVYPVDLNDWKIAFNTVQKKLKDLIDDDFKVVIFSNQAPIGKGRVSADDFRKKLENIIQKLAVPVQAYIATGNNIYRKPTTGMWKVLVEQKNDGTEIDMNQSFYCGDAAGRVVNWAPGKKKDHSMADILFAENVGLKFYTPEQFFLGHSTVNVQMKKPEFNPKDLSAEPFNENLICKDKEILVMVGFPGSGKSFLSKQIEQKSGHQYVSVCRDVFGSWQKCVSEATKLLKMGKSVIVDSTNPDVESRSRWTELGKEMKVKCRCVVMAVTLAHAQHNNKFRELMKIKHLPVNDIVFHSYKNKYTEPKSSEGFSEIIKVKFNPSFDDDQAEKLYRMHLLEK